MSKTPSRAGIAALSSEVAIDLGTATIQVVEQSRGLIVDEPTVIAVDRRTGDVKDFGRVALQLFDNDPDGIDLVWPMSAGAVSDPIALQRLLSRVLRPLSSGFMNRTRVLITVSSGSTAAERRAVRDAAKRAGASSVQLIEHVVAAALGADLPIHEPVGTFILDVGAGVTEAALLSLGSVVSSATVRAGSATVDGSIKNVLRREYGMVISDITAEEIKLAMSNAPVGKDTLIEARGQMAVDGSTMTAILERDEMQKVLDAYLDASVDAVRECLVSVSPDLAQDVVARGMYIVGGGAQLGGLRERLRNEFAIEINVIADADRVVVAGAAKCLEDPDSLRRLFVGGE